MMQEAASLGRLPSLREGLGLAQCSIASACERTGAREALCHKLIGH